MVCERLKCYVIVDIEYIPNGGKAYLIVVLLMVYIRTYNDIF